MRFKYIDSDGPAQTIAHGVAFELGQFSEVSDPEAIKWFQRNRYFEQEVERVETKDDTQDAPVKKARKRKTT